MKWHCERQNGDEKHHDSGFMIICEAHGLPWAYLLRDEVLKTANDPVFLFCSAVRSIKRAISEYAKKCADARQFLGLRKHLDTMLDGGWNFACRDPLCIGCGDRSATVVEGMVIEHGAPVGMRRFSDVFAEAGQ